MKSVSNHEKIHFKQVGFAMDVDDDIPFTPRRRVSVDRPSQPTYPWRKPSITEEVNKLLNTNDMMNIIREYFYDAK